MGLPGEARGGGKNRTQNVLWNHGMLIHSLLLPSALALQHSLVEREKKNKKQNRLLSQTKLGLNSRSTLKNPIRWVLSYSSYRRWFRSQWYRYVRGTASVHATGFILQLEKLRHRPIYEKQKRAQELTE